MDIVQESNRRLKKIKSKKTGKGSDIFRLLDLNIKGNVINEGESALLEFNKKGEELKRNKKQTRFIELKRMWTANKLKRSSVIRELLNLYKLFKEELPEDLKPHQKKKHPSYKPVKPSKRKRTPTRYSAYIESQAWADRKNKYYQTYGKKCSVCGSTKYVSLHHLDYTRLGKELDSDLVAACWSCHQRFHKEYGVHRESRSDWMEFSKSKGVTIELGNSCTIRVML